MPSLYNSKGGQFSWADIYSEVAFRCTPQSDRQASLSSPSLRSLLSHLQRCPRKTQAGEALPSYFMKHAHPTHTPISCIFFLHDDNLMDTLLLTHRVAVIFGFNWGKKCLSWCVSSTAGKKFILQAIMHGISRGTVSHQHFEMQMYSEKCKRRQTFLQYALFVLLVF